MTEFADTLEGVDIVFRRCVEFLETLAMWTGLTYEEVNVLLFCVLWPLLTLWLAWQAWISAMEARRLMARTQELLELQIRMQSEAISRQIDIRLRELEQRQRAASVAFVGGALRTRRNSGLRRRS